MCDGVTHGQSGMELSLFSRDTITMATAIALSHNMFDAALCLGVCDKIVPGLFTGALRFGHLPGSAFIPPNTPLRDALTAAEPFPVGAVLEWREAPAVSGDLTILRPVTEPFNSNGRRKLRTGNLGRSVIKTSAVKAEHRVVTAPALVTDGRMSGASGSVPAAIHVTPECLNDGPLRHVRDGDVIHLDSIHGLLEARVPLAEWQARQMIAPDLGHHEHGMSRELFRGFRARACDAEAGADTFGG